MLRHSKKKALVDASYNRYAWNDGKDLPSWFQDDEMRHNKPQVGMLYICINCMYTHLYTLIHTIHALPRDELLLGAKSTPATDGAMEWIASAIRRLGCGFESHEVLSANSGW